MYTLSGCGRAKLHRETSEHGAAAASGVLASAAASRLRLLTDQRDHHLVIVIEQELIGDDRGVASFDLVVHTLAGLDLREIPEHREYRGNGSRVAADSHRNTHEHTVSFKRTRAVQSTRNLSRKRLRVASASLTK